MPKRVFFDESGYVGANLFDSEQPYFALASGCLDDEDLRSLFDCFAATPMSELKFATLRKSKKGQRMVKEMLELEIVSEDTVKIFAVYHPWMVTTKYCDLVIEPSMKSIGIDFYKDRMNVDIAEFLFNTMPSFVGR